MRYFILAPIAFVFTLLAMLLAPVLALFVRNGTLPYWLAWFDTPDNLTVGDAQFQRVQMGWTKSRYLYALFWLWRNPAYGFDYAIGAKITTPSSYKFRGDDLVSNTPLHSGWVFRTVDGYWQLLAIYPLMFGNCIKINLGWKLWYGHDAQDYDNAAAQGLPKEAVKGLRAGDVRQLVCTVNPFTKYD